MKTEPLRVTDSWLEACAARLEAMGRQPLGLRPDFPEVAARWEAWWRFGADRPLLVGSAREAELSGADAGPGFGLVDDPVGWTALHRRRVEHTYFAGDTVPAARVELGPVCQAAFVGAPLHLSEDESTSWQKPIIEDWRNRPSLALDPANRWYRTALALAKTCAEDAAGDYTVMLPDMGGAMDVLANLRDPQRLCMDLFENRDRVRDAAQDLVDVWDGSFAGLYEAVLDAGAGVMQWLGCWSNRPYFLATCDFNFLIGPDDFRDVCMPSLRAQAERAGRCVIHLDGAPRHVDALIEEPAITAIQYTPGDGTPSAIPHIPMYKRIQAAGKPVIVTLPAEEIDDVIRELDPRGVALRPSPVRSREAAEAMMATIRRRFG